MQGMTSVRLYGALSGENTKRTCGCPGQGGNVNAWQEDELAHTCERQEEHCEGDALQQLGAAQQRQPQRQPCPPACACPQSQSGHLSFRAPPDQAPESQSHAFTYKAHTTASQHF